MNFQKLMSKMVELDQPIKENIALTDGNESSKPYVPSATVLAKEYNNDPMKIIAAGLKAPSSYKYKLFLEWAEQQGLDNDPRIRNAEKQGQIEAYKSGLKGTENELYFYKIIFPILAKEFNYSADRNVEEGMSDLHADIADLMGRHIEKYNRIGGAEHLMSRVDPVAAKIARTYDIDQDAARKHVISYIKSSIQEELTQGMSESLEECGEMGPVEPMKQTDSVNMNVSLNASGANGIRDLLDVLSNIQDSSDSSDDVEMPIAIKTMGMALDDDFANEPSEKYHDIDVMTGSGNDLHGNASRGDQGDRYDGYSPRGVPTVESLIPRLSSLYQQVKNR